MSDEIEKPARILYVEDDPAAVVRLPALLHPLPHVIWNEENGSTAFERLESGQHTPDIVLTDWRHPGLDGYELSAQIKSSARLCDLPVVFFSRNAYRSFVRRAIVHGADVAVPWPLAVDDLLYLIIEVTIRGPRPHVVARLLELDEAFYCSDTWRQRALGIRVASGRDGP